MKNGHQKVLLVNNGIKCNLEEAKRRKRWKMNEVTIDLILQKDENPVIVIIMGKKDGYTSKAKSRKNGEVTNALFHKNQLGITRSRL